MERLRKRLDEWEAQVKRDPMPVIMEMKKEIALLHQELYSIWDEYMSSRYPSGYWDLGQEMPEPPDMAVMTMTEFKALQQMRHRLTQLTLR